jgi:hypothetical protein
MEDTLPGYLLTDLTFCSKANQSQFSNDSCPDECVNNSDNPYWIGASMNFARNAVGRAVVVLNGSREIGAIRLTSVFYRIEAPNLDPSKVNTLKVLLLHDLDAPKHETCDMPRSLLKLKEITDAKGIKYECEDNPDNIELFMCFENPQSRECLAIKAIYKRSIYNA